MGHVLATLNADRRPLHHRGLDYAIATFFGCCYFGLIALRRAYPVDAHTIVRRYEVAGHTMKAWNRDAPPLALRRTQRTDQLGGRKLAAEGSLERRFWTQTGGRHNLYYFRSLTEYAAIDVSGGYFFDGDDDGDGGDGGGGGGEGGVAPPAGRAILQWESFKLWEAFAAGAAVLMPHLEAHGMRLPVMPVAGEHYVPIAFDNASVDALAAKLQAGAVDFGRIGAAGRKWALEHYTPKANGARFLADVARARRRKKQR